MTALIRKAICEKISQIVKRNNVYYELEVPAKKQHNASNMPLLQWSVRGNTEENREVLNALPRLGYDRDIIRGVRLVPAAGKVPAKVEFYLEPTAYAASVLQPQVAPEPILEEHMVFDFSSPNIAKPFHVGHLRSTIIGNVLANLHKHLGYRVTKLNYLGDWGTQFGMLQVGVELLGVTEEQVQHSAIETLYKAYVAANTAAKTDPTIAERARRHFRDLESGRSSLDIVQQWKLYRQYTIMELEQTYGRLGVHFDSYEWESQYSQKQISEVVQQLEAKGLLLTEHDGRRVAEVGERRVPIIKSDGSTLYLARDIAALLDRWRRFRFSNMFYVVENGQTDHFKACFTITSRLCDELASSQLKHVKFGRIHGMSTRSGQAIFLGDVLDEARDIMHEKQLQSTTTKIPLNGDRGAASKQVADVLGVSAVIVNDLKQRRQRDYNFDWQKALQVNGDTGVKLQYTHCRLHSLLEQTSHIDVSGSQPSMEHLMEPEAQDLLHEIARFTQTLWQTKEQLEACVLVNYLFSLCNTTSRAWKHLNVKNEPNPLKQQQRILLFRAAKATLKCGMEILGLRPLNKM